MKSISVKWVVLIAGLGLVSLALAAVYLFPFLVQQKSIVPANSSSNQPNMKITDMAPAIPANKKTAIVVMHSDSSYEKVLIPSGTAEAYIKGLPEGDKVVSQISPAK